MTIIHTTIFLKRRILKSIKVNKATWEVDISWKRPGWGRPEGANAWTEERKLCARGCKVRWGGNTSLSSLYWLTQVKWSRSVVSDSLRPHWLQPTRLLRPWDSPGKNIGMGCLFLLQSTCLNCGFLSHIFIYLFFLISYFISCLDKRDVCSLYSMPDAI